MAANDGMRLKVNIKLSPAARDYFQRFPAKLKNAQKEVVETCGIIWSDETKAITQEEDHIDTSLYINSIGYSTGTPSDPRWDLEEGQKQTKLTVGTGSSVSYAAALEKRYNLMARGLDRSEARMKTNLKNVIRRNLDL